MWKTDHGDAGDGLSELRAASSLKDLHRLIVMRQVSGRSTQHQEAVELFVHHHGEDSTGAVDTALLLCTEPRWQRCTAKLIAGICEAEILDDRALDELAGRLLWQDRPLIRHPLSWLGLEWTALDLRDWTVVGRGVDQDRLVDNERPPARPPLLRWAAGHLLRRKRTDLDRLRKRAASLDALHGPPVIAGALDVVDWLTDDDARRVIDLGLASGRAQARKVALRVLADRIDRTEAVRRARADPHHSIRRWAPQLESLAAGTTPTTLF
ncbi:MAG: hypothetical protein M3Y48_19020 [Actinomycetota bacterium]|nr:hypothetical protein [Actinomycetota bacterium]